MLETSDFHFRISWRRLRSNFLNYPGTFESQQLFSLIKRLVGIPTIILYRICNVYILYSFYVCTCVFVHRKFQVETCLLRSSNKSVIISMGFECIYRTLYLWWLTDDPFVALEMMRIIVSSLRECTLNTVLSMFHRIEWVQKEVQPKTYTHT